MIRLDMFAPWLLVLMWVSPPFVAASQIVYRDTDLAGALRAARVVVCGKYLGGHHPARFEVISTHLGEPVQSGSIIDVYSKTSEAWARARGRNGMRRSPIVRRLPSPPSAELIEENNYCLLLNPGAAAGEFVLSVEDAHIAAPCPALIDLIEGEADDGSDDAEEPDAPAERPDVPPVDRDD